MKLQFNIGYCLQMDNYSYFEEWSNAEQRIERAHEHYDNARWQEALQELQGAIETNPTNGNWFFNKGLTLDTLGRYSEAIEAFEQARELNLEDPEVLNCLGVDYTRLGQYDRALRIFEEVEVLVPDFEPCFCNRIITYAEMGRHEEAEQMFYLARQLKEHCPLCYYNIGNSLFSQQLYDRAIWCWEQTRNLDPDHPQINSRIAQAYWAKGEHQKAKENFLAHLRQQPGDIEVLLDTAILLLEMNELDSAREKLHRILELNPDQPQVHHYLGELYLNDGSLSRAVECFNRALTLNPHQDGCHFRLAQCYLYLEQRANARENLLAELKNSPNQADVLLELGCLLEEVGAIAEAMNCFERVIDAHPENIQAYYNLSVSYFRNGLPDQGIELSLRVLELQSDHIFAMHNLAFAYLQKDEIEKAHQYIQMACDRAPNDGRILRLKRTINFTRLVSNLCRSLRGILFRG